MGSLDDREDRLDSTRTKPEMHGSRQVRSWPCACACELRYLEIFDHRTVVVDGLALDGLAHSLAIEDHLLWRLAVVEAIGVWVVHGGESDVNELFARVQEQIDRWIS